MNIDTKHIKKGLITIDGKPIKVGMSVSEVEQILQTEIGVDREYVGYVTGGMTEDGRPMSVTTRFKDDLLHKLEVNIGGFDTVESALEKLDEWLEDREITEWIGDSYYKTDFGTISPSVVRNSGIRPGGCKISVSMNYDEIRERKFLPIKKNKKNTVIFEVDGSAYAIQRVPHQEVDNLPVGSWLGDGPQSLLENESWNVNDRKEEIYFTVSKIEDDKTEVIGIAQFTYFAFGEAYRNGELFYVLDGLTEEWGIIGFMIEGLDSETEEFTPFMLVYEGIHDELPFNKELQAFQEDELKLEMLFNAALRLTTEYVKIPDDYLTLVEVSRKRNNLLPCYKTIEDIFINYRLPE